MEVMFFIYGMIKSIIKTVQLINKWITRDDNIHQTAKVLVKQIKAVGLRLYGGRGRYMQMYLFYKVIIIEKSLSLIKVKS